MRIIALQTGCMHIHIGEGFGVVCNCTHWLRIHVVVSSTKPLLSERRVINLKLETGWLWFQLFVIIFERNCDTCWSEELVLSE